MTNTYSDFKSRSASRKTVLANIEASKRLMGWSIWLGSVYRIAFQESVISSITQDGSLLTQGSSTVLSSGEYYFDDKNQFLYIRTTDDSNPNSKFIAVIFQNFYSNDGFKGEYDLNTGKQVYWRPLISGTSDFGFELDTKQIGSTVESQGSITFLNDQSYWSSRYDKLVWENKSVTIYAGSPDIDVTEFQKIFKGKIVDRSWTDTTVTFKLKDQFFNLRRPVETPNISEYSNARVPTSDENKKQRRVYGYVFGHKPSPIDQVSDGEFEGYPLSGTVFVSNGSTSVTGTGTSFLNDLSPNDEIRFNESGSFFTVESVSNDTTLTLTEEYNGSTLSAANLYIRPARPKNYINRIFILSHHKLRKPQTTISAVDSDIRFDVNDTTDLLEGDTVTINGDSREILRISNSNIRLRSALDTTPSVGDSVVRPSVTNVRLNTRQLTETRDYTINNNTEPSTIVLTNDAEFNVAPVFVLDGTNVSFTTGSRAVTGTGTTFKSDLKAGDFLRIRPNADYFEISSIEDDTNLTLKTNASYTATGTAEYKSPDYVDNRDVILSCDLLGKTSTGEPDGVLLKTGPKIVEDLLSSSGFSSDLNNASFDSASDKAPYRLGLVIPEDINKKRETELRKAIQKVNESIIGSLIQNTDFQLEYAVLEPSKKTISAKFKESDVLSFSVDTDASLVIKKIILNYLFKENNFLNNENSNETSEKTSDIATFLSQTNREKEIDTILIDQSDADLFASRWSFLYSIANTIISFDTKLQASTLQANDSVVFEHRKIFERFGSEDQAKVMAVQSAFRSGTGSKLELFDLSSFFSRIAVITDNDAPMWNEASDEQKRTLGFITDQYGLINNDSDTFGINLIY